MISHRNSSNYFVMIDRVRYRSRSRVAPGARAWTRSGAGVNDQICVASERASGQIRLAESGC